ncbi:MAG: hypothetical protein LBH95_06215, partial [Oscillospiraceae bacterium]|nr:hypothetical protein [Oscillospiraceae bacterium]
MFFCERGLFDFLTGEGNFKVSLFRFQFVKPLFDRGVGDTFLNGIDYIPDSFFNITKLFLQKRYGCVLALLKLYNRVREPDDNFITENVISRQSDNMTLYPVFLDGFLVTGFLVNGVAAFVVVMNLSSLARAANA